MGEGLHPAQIVHGRAPLNAEPPMALLRRSFVTPRELFYVRSHGDVPDLDPEAHRVAVGGRVERPLSLTLRDLRSGFASVTVRAVIQCAGNRRADLGAVRPVQGDPWAGGAIGCADWTGVPLADVLAVAGAASEDAHHVAFTGADLCRCGGGREAYGVSIPMAKARERDVLVAFAMNGAPLARAHGAPLRLVVPGFAGARSPKWLAAIHVQDRPSRAHHQAADYKLYPPDVGPETEDPARGTTIEAMPLTSAICDPSPGARLAAGPNEIAGYAVAGAHPVARVEVSADGGRTWRTAEIEPQAGSRWAWVFWRARLDVAPGERELCVRAFDDAGLTQPARPEEVWNFKGYLSTAWHRVRVGVA